MTPVQVPSYEENLAQRPIMKGMGEERGECMALSVNCLPISFIAVVL